MAGEREVVAVTGSSGLIGAALASRLDRIYTEVGFDRPGEPHPPAHIDCIDLDVGSDESVRAGLRQLRERHGDRLASFFHLVAYYDFSGEPSDKYEEVTVRGTERLLHGLRDFRCEQFVFSSTMLVHKPGEPGRKITEGSPVEATWDYPASKARTEEVIRRERGTMPAVLLRVAGVYTDRGDSIPLAHQMQRVHEKQLTSHVYPADPIRGQAFVHLDDVVECIVRCIERRASLPAETVLLVGEPETLGYGELQERFGQLIHCEEWATYRVPAAVASPTVVVDTLARPRSCGEGRSWQCDPQPGRWAGELDAVAERIGPHFARSEPRRRAVGYVRGLLSDAERKNGWHLAEATPDGVQHLLARAGWDADAVRDDLTRYGPSTSGRRTAASSWTGRGS